MAQAAAGRKRNFQASLPGETPAPDFVLVQWIEDDSVGVMPMTAVKAEEKERSVGAVVDIRWKGKKTYPAEILKISSNRRQLNKLCDALINFQITPEDLVCQDFDLEDPQADDPMKSAPKKFKKGKENKHSSGVKKAKQIKNAKEGHKEKAKLQKAAKNSAALEQAKQIFSFNISSDSSQSDDDDDLLDITSRELQKELIKQKKQIEQLQVQLKNKTKDVKCQVPIAQLAIKKESSPQAAEKQPSSARESLNNSMSSSDTSEDSLAISNYIDDHNNTVKVQPLMVELVPGYGVRCTKRQRDEAVSASNTATKLIRNLLPIFFSQSTLATHSCGGRGTNPALDQDIIAACIAFVQSIYKGTARTILVDHINDKCASSRRQLKDN